MSTGSVSLRRADTRRNHERILTVAASPLTRSGEISFNSIAKAAGVGVGTVYRHFPTPEALILAVYEREVRQLVEVVPALLADHGPEAAFRVWACDHLARYMMTKRGLADALRGVSLPAGAFPSIVDALGLLLSANVSAGCSRAVDPRTVMRGLGGLLYLDPEGDWKGEASLLVDLLWRGLSC